MKKFTHFDQEGNAIMVDITNKSDTCREALATGKIYVNADIMDSIINQDNKKGDVLGVARVAGITAVKKTWDLIPMSHNINLSGTTVLFYVNEEENVIECKCSVKTTGKTGVEMEALTGVSISLLTIYDMCKAIDKHMRIEDIHLVTKTGGKSGDFSYD